MRNELNTSLLSPLHFASSHTSTTYEFLSKLVHLDIKNMHLHLHPFQTTNLSKRLLCSIITKLVYFGMCTINWIFHLLALHLAFPETCIHSVMWVLETHPPSCTSIDILWHKKKTCSCVSTSKKNSFCSTKIKHCVNLSMCFIHLKYNPSLPLNPASFEGVITHNHHGRWVVVWAHF